MNCSQRVFRCFKSLEKLGDRITGAAGPYFVGFAVILISCGTFCFFDVIAPSLSFPLLSWPLCILIALNLHFHYFYVVTVPPGFLNDPPREPGTSIFWARKNKGKKPLTGVRWSQGGIEVTPAQPTKCWKCRVSRPERTHHCKICNKCVLKYDHHCPVRINQCVGLHNERHFVMFMVYLVIATFCYCLLGLDLFLNSLGISYSRIWPYYSPEILFALMYILCGVLCFAVGVMLAYHLYNISNGETSVESQDHDQYRRKAKSRHEEFVNSYDLGRKKNFQFFFNIGPDGYPLYTLFIPLRINPYTDGTAWARRAGFDKHHGLRQGEELTDDEEDDV